MIDTPEREDTRRQLRERLRSLPSGGSANVRARRLRALLEELGVHCDETVELEELDAVLLASARGTDALVAARLDDEQRHRAYARLVARLLITEMRPPVDAKMEYATAEGHERGEEATSHAIARALVDGRLDAAPRPFYDDVPKLTLAFTPRSAARSTLAGMHLWSNFWYKRSDLYRRWRASRGVSDAIGRICEMVA